MKPNPILAEIRRTREELARETNYNLQQLFDYVREREHEAAAHGVIFVSPAPRETEADGVLREEPPRLKSGRKA
jgi:hypothetical protein